MTKKLVWRLSKLPEPSELSKLVELKIITQEEAKAILLKQEDDDERDKKSLEDEIKFLRGLVDKLSQNKNNIVEVIKTIEVEVPVYKKYPWYEPYKYYCSNDVSQYQITASNNSDFSNIKTF